jgi:Secretion system C-terminal sorting domain
MIKKILLTALIMNFYWESSFSQIGSNYCSQLTTAQINKYDSTLLAFKEYMLSQGVTLRSSSTEIKYFLLNYVIIEKNGSTGGVDRNRVDFFTNILNDYFINSNIQFVNCVDPTRIANTTLYDLNMDNDDGLLNPYRLKNKLNIIFIDQILSSGGHNISGYASYGVVIEKTEDEFLLLHEMGHVFGLAHTFGGSPYGNVKTDELVNRNPSNCENTGDRLCSTPADPYPRGQFTQTISELISGHCSYTTNETDAEGQVYAPDVTNIMSYSICKSRFTSEQYALMEFNAINSSNVYYEEERNNQMHTIAPTSLSSSYTISNNVFPEGTSYSTSTAVGLSPVYEARNTIANNSNIEYYNILPIKFLPGFKVESGCHFATKLGCDGVSLTKWTESIEFWRTKTESFDSNRAGIISTISIEEPIISLYPNPASDMVNVEIENLEGNATIAMYSFSGALIYTKIITDSKTAIDMSGYEAGIYMVTITTDTQHKSIKVVKQ